MKRLIFALALIFSCLYFTEAQGQRIFLFNNFNTATIRMKNGYKAKSPINYDANRGKMYFVENNELMELTNVMQIDSVYIGDKKFVQQNGDFAEVFNSQNGVIRIIWRIHKIHEGYVGAYGTSQVPSKKIQLQSNFGMGTFAGTSGGMYNGTFGTNNDKDGGINLDIWKMKSENVYYFIKDGKEYKVDRLKRLYKLFPQDKEKIQEYVRKNSLDLMSVDKAVKVIDYVLSL